jgi:hypothetical protein
MMGIKGFETPIQLAYVTWFVAEFEFTEIADV